MALFSKTMRKHIFVHPAQQTKLQTAVKATLLKDKKKFSDKLEGALMDVANLHVVGKHHLIVDGYLSMEIEGDFQVFRPTVGMLLEGVVNKISKGHVGCLVMNLFNASLTISPNSDVSLNVGDSCEFTVTDVIIDGDILSLRGALSSGLFGRGKDETGKEELEPEKKKKTNDSKAINITDENSSNDELFSRGILTQLDPTPKSKKSPKKMKVKEEPDNELGDGNEANSPTSSHEEMSRNLAKSPQKSKTVATSLFTSVKPELHSPHKNKSHKSKRKSSESSDAHGVMIKREAVSPFKESQYLSPQKNTSPSKKAKKNKNR